VLLPSKELRDLSKKVSICLAGKVAPKGCDIRYRQNYWLLVFNTKSEIIGACDLGKMLTKQKGKGVAIPLAFVAFVEDALRQNESLDSIERDFIVQKGSKDALLALKTKLLSMDRVGQMRVARFLTKNAKQTKNSAWTEAKALQLSADACSHQVINFGAFSDLKKSMTTFIITNISSPMALNLIAPLLDVSLKYEFDVAAYCRSLEVKLKKLAEGKDEQTKKKIAEFARALHRHKNQSLAKTITELSESKVGDWGRPRLLAQLGRAQQLSDALKTAKSFGVMKPIHANWRQLAKITLEGK
jgi:hypothetical protein